MRYWAVVLLLTFGACAQTPPPPLAVRAGEVVLTGQIVSADAAEGTLTLAVASAQAAKGPARRIDPPCSAELRLSLFGRPPALARTDTASLLHAVKPGQSVSMVVARAGTAAPALLAVLDLAIDGQPALGRPKPPWPNLRDSTASDAPTVPLIFPVLGDALWNDTWLKPVAGNPHIGQDLKGPRLTPLLACFGGVVWMEPKADPTAARSLVILGDDGWQALYTHLNNDSPGTTDNSAGHEYAFAPGIEKGARVVPGQLLGWMGDSGYATGPHVHFELRGPDRQLHNAAPSLRAARHLSEPAPMALWPQVKAAPGQLRLAGIVRSVNVSAHRIYLGVRQRNGATTSSPLYAIVSVDSATALHVRGVLGATLSLAELTAGTPLVLVADAGNGGSPVAHEIWVERQGLVVNEALRSAVDELARGGA